MAEEDIDHPPASDREDVQGFLDMQWREAMRAAREGMEALRSVHPELMEHLPEIAERSISMARANMEAAYRELHRAGVPIIGQAKYDEYIEAQTRRAIGG